MHSILYLIKIAIVLILISLAVLISGQLTELLPDHERSSYDARKSLSNSLALQLSAAALKNDFSSLKAILAEAIDSNSEIRSAAIHTPSGEHLEMGNHHQSWRSQPPAGSASREIRVPIIHNREILGTLEVAFNATDSDSRLSTTELSILVLLIILSGLILSLLFSNRISREFNAKSIIPERVRSAFNALSEGLIILDEKERIVLANDSFMKQVSQDQQTLIGKAADQLRWKLREGDNASDVLPWRISLRDGERKTGIPVRLELKNKTTRAFSVNTAPILDSQGEARGVLATFDDMSDLEMQHRQLQSTLSKLRISQKALRDKTVELEFLATRDSLSGCLNRRAFFKKFDALFEASQKQGKELVFMMVDIDRFKYINDYYGHANGDKVIKFIAEILNSNSRPEDVVGRYGGDEFSLVLPQADLVQAESIAERLRMDIQQKCRALFTNPQTVTTSIGLAALTDDVDDSMLLINKADSALYEAKQQGRNCIVAWSPAIKSKDDHDQKTSISAISELIKKEDGAAEKFLQSEIHHLEDVVRQLESELEYSREELKRREGKDELTGLPNRFIFNDRVTRELTRCQRNRQSAAIVSLDIDNFSRINEALGFNVGDQILKLIAERLVVSLRKTDTVAVIDERNDTESSNISRLSKDEFALILTDVADIKSVTWVVRRILSRLKKPMHVDDQELFVSFSIGVALYPHDSDTSNDLLQQAATARHAAKKDPGSNNIRFFSREINRKAYHSIWLETQLRKAIVRQQFELVYQPKIDLQTGRITTMEALARWPHQKVGLIPPAEFIPVAEHTGLINKLGNWVFKRACADLRRWHKSGYHDLHIAVNLSAVQLRENALAEKFLRICEKRKIPPSTVEFEITESTLIENFEHTRNVMSRMNKAGIKFALDDFGKGFSSLSYLQNLPISSIKIDRSFLHSTLPDKQALAIVTAIISLAKSLGLKVVAEGVETETQQQILQQLNCDEIQGILYSEPVTMDKATSLLQDFNG
ncbi:MAG: diguanylate cyclase [Candidatus Thiodiazotropha sp. (ex Dulcina madagascariensis)]|nr:diguanylate cyclase [Candidatus Thiodiazotropha sp. (ex Dulcina madagascariensis)]MCU7927045.1 diguanylate cyclase [Candidatus Thiodiazotropha sp. (ex Dulcina madagascariensis)]